MTRLVRFLNACVFPAVLAGCTLNSVRPLPAGASIDESRAVVVFGVGVEGEWNYAGYSAQLDEYDLRAQAITGNCFRFNRMNGTVPPTPGAVRYFSFDTPAGVYAYSAFNGARLAPETGAGTPAFAARAGRVVYMADFIYTKQGTVSIRRDVDAAKRYLAAFRPDLRGELTQAEEFLVHRPNLFMCTP
jgi:hypothetical protein